MAPQLGSPPPARHRLGPRSFLGSPGAPVPSAHGPLLAAGLRGPHGLWAASDFAAHVLSTRGTHTPTRQRPRHGARPRSPWSLLGPRAAHPASRLPQPRPGRQWLRLGESSSRELPHRASCPPWRCRRGCPHRAPTPPPGGAGLRVRLKPRSPVGPGPGGCGARGRAPSPAPGSPLCQGPSAPSRGSKGPHQGRVVVGGGQWPQQ